MNEKNKANKAILVLEYESEIRDDRSIQGNNMELMPATSPIDALYLLEENHEQIDRIILNAHLCEIGDNPAATAAITAIFKSFKGKIVITCGRPTNTTAQSYRELSSSILTWR